MTNAPKHTHHSADVAEADHLKHDHDHGNPFFIPFILVALFSGVEVFGGLWTQSLALLSDAWHMLTDVFALGLAMYASHQAAKAKTQHPSHIERYASIINAILMLVVIAWIMYEAIQRFDAPKAVSGGYVMLIAFIGLIVNIIVAQRLHHLANHHGGDKNLNQRAALLHVMGDLLGSVAAIVAGAVIYFTGWMKIDPILSIIISMLLLAFTFNLIRDIARGESTHTHHLHHDHNHHHDHHH